jgi:hypothetical protein
MLFMTIFIGIFNNFRASNFFFFFLKYTTTFVAFVIFDVEPI